MGQENKTPTFLKPIFKFFFQNILKGGIKQNP
jgi:hypothetical protein